MRSGIIMCLVLVINVALLAGVVYLVVLLVRALRKYLRTEKHPEEPEAASLAELFGVSVEELI